MLDWADLGPNIMVTEIDNIDKIEMGSNSKYVCLLQRFFNLHNEEKEPQNFIQFTTQYRLV